MSFRDAGKQVFKIIIIIFYLFLENNASDFSFICDRQSWKPDWPQLLATVSKSTFMRNWLLKEIQWVIG